MRLVRCDACGSKAILAASQCPKCAEPLYVRDSRGDDVPLTRCRACDTYYPRSRENCRWCSAARPVGVPRWASTVAGVVVIAGVVIIAGAALGVSRFVPATSPRSAPNVTQPEEPSPPLRVVAREPGITRLPPATIVPVVAAGTLTTGLALRHTRTVNLPPDSGRRGDARGRSFARATTWVNVRAEPNSESSVIGIILPDSIVERGELRRGWRRIITLRLTGWAAEKLFVADSALRSGS